MPELYIITGSNGAGKSSVGAISLPKKIRDNYAIFDGDKLFMEKQKDLWQNGISANKEAKKLALEFVIETFEKLVEEALQANHTFVYEGHFTNDATWDIPKRFKTNGYKINLIFLGLITPDLSEFRVMQRVNNHGGHFVPRHTVEDNFYGNLEKLNKYYALIDNLVIIDSSEAKHNELAAFSDLQLISSVPCNELPGWFLKYLPQLSGKIKR
jgi:predicted ABC-type ATPase